MKDKLPQLRFDFEKQFILDIHHWISELIKPEILMTKFDSSVFDLGMGVSVDQELTKITSITSFIENGQLCGHSASLQSGDLPWVTNDDGRIWTASELWIYKEDLGFPCKLKRLLQTEIYTLEQIIKYRQAVLCAFKTYDSLLPQRYQKNLFKQGVKLDRMMAEYKHRLRTEMTIRKLITSMLAFRQKEVNRKHKMLIRDLTQVLKRVIHRLCFDCTDLRRNHGDADDNNSSYATRKCYQCLNNKQKNGDIDQIDLSDGCQGGGEEQYEQKSMNDLPKYYINHVEP